VSLFFSDCFHAFERFDFTLLFRQSPSVSRHLSENIFGPFWMIQLLMPI
jgi:hypothetical protein